MSVTSTLTDGTGISNLTLPKVLKDALLDFMLGLPGVFIALNVTGLEQALAVPVAVSFGVGDLLVRVAYRASIKWLQT